MIDVVKISDIFLKEKINLPTDLLTHDVVQIFLHMTNAKPVFLSLHRWR